MTNVISITQEPQETPKHYNVLWSGGVDSTFLVYDLLEKGHRVTTTYIGVKNNQEKGHHELKQRKVMAEFFYEKYGHKFNYKETPNITIDISGVGHVKLGQAIAWIGNSIITLREEHDYMAIGYVKGDDAIEYLDIIRESFNSLKRLSYAKTEIVFPLVEKEKLDMFNALPIELKDNVFWCERGETDATNCYCQPCKKARKLGIVNKYQYKDFDKIQEMFKVAAE